jgi:hypothetical protein
MPPRRWAPDALECGELLTSQPQRLRQATQCLTTRSGFPSLEALNAANAEATAVGQGLLREASDNTPVAEQDTEAS